jgi:hypothetical protein
LHAEPYKKDFPSRRRDSRFSFWDSSHLREVSARPERIFDSFLAVSHRLLRVACDIGCTEEAI